MTDHNFFSHPNLLDYLALSWFFMVWIVYHFYSAFNSRCSLQKMMNKLREQWAITMLERDVKIMDTQIINGLISKDTFFASTTILILASTIALMGLKEEVDIILHGLPLFDEASYSLWEVKVMLLAMIFVYAFFKFSWSIRQHSYSAILLGSIPEKSSGIKPEIRRKKALRLARLSNLGGRNFNDGLRAYYFALAELTWFVNPIFFMIVTTWIVAVLYRREFHSRSLELLSDTYDKKNTRY